MKSEISIFFDTNMLLMPIYSDNKALGDFSFNNINKVIKIINYYNASNVIKIFIPEVVVFETKQKIIEEYANKKIEFEEKMAQYKKIFGKRLTFSELKSTEDLALELESEISKYIEKNKAKFTVLPLPKSYDKIISRAFNKEPLFVKTRDDSNKEFSDAGLKDTILFEIIAENINISEANIFISKDKGFVEHCKKNGIVFVENIESLSEVLEDIKPVLKFNKIITEFNYETKIEEIKALVKINGKRDLEGKNIKISYTDKAKCHLEEETGTATLYTYAHDDGKTYFLEIHYDYITLEIQDAFLKKVLNGIKC